MNQSWMMTGGRDRCALWTPIGGSWGPREHVTTIIHHPLLHSRPLISLFYILLQNLSERVLYLCYFCICSSQKFWGIQTTKQTNKMLNILEQTQKLLISVKNKIVKNLHFSGPSYLFLHSGAIY